MTYNWHCRGCDKKGETDVIASAEQIYEIMQKEKASFLAALTLFVQRTIHKDCPDADLGIKAGE
jgi:hypothetical protein